MRSIVNINFFSSLPKRNENTCPHKDLYVKVHSSLIQKSPKVETIQCPSVGEWIDKRWHSHTCVEVTPKEEIKGHVEPMDSHTIQQ